jgi:hypothetical protein
MAKRKSTTRRKSAAKRPRTKSTEAKLKKIVRRALSRAVEVKQTVHSATDGTQIFHNNFIVLDSNVLETTQGTADHMTASTNNRIGDEIMLKGVSMKLMVELNERYSDVTFRMFVVKKAKGDTLDASTFFTGLSGNKMLDNINTERFSVLYTKTFKVTAPNQGTQQNSHACILNLWHHVPGASEDAGWRWWICWTRTTSVCCASFLRVLCFIANMHTSCAQPRGSGWRIH